MTDSGSPDIQEELGALREQLRRSEDRLVRRQYENDLLRRVGSSIDIDELLTLFGQELESHAQVEGYLINLIDADRDNLVCHKLHLPAAFQEVESTYRNLHFPLKQNDPNILCFQEQRPIVLHADDMSDRHCTTGHRFERWNMQSLIIVPFLVGPRCLGTIMLFRCDGVLDEAIISATENLLEIFRKPILNALHHANLKAKEDQLNAALAAQKQFLRFIAQVNSLTSTESIHDMISREFLERFPFDLAGLLTLEGESLKLRRLSASKPEHEPVRDAVTECFRNTTYELDEADGASPLVFLKNSPLYFRDARQIMDLPMSAKDRASLETMGTARTVFIVPIRHQERPTGVLWLVSLEQPVELTDDDRTFIELLCSFIGTAMANAELYSTVGSQKQKIEQLNRELEQKVEELKLLASRDQLTGLANFGAFETELARRIAEVEREPERGLAIALLDVDHFKRFNDTHGHVAGNKVLQEVARRLEWTARSMDLVCRYGGEEFIVILPKCGLDGARIFSERTRRNIAEESFIISGQPLHITASIGCAAYQAGESLSAFVERADQALYKAKNDGRNRVACHQP